MANAKMMDNNGIRRRIARQQDMQILDEAEQDRVIGQLRRSSVLSNRIFGLVLLLLGIALVTIMGYAMWNDVQIRVHYITNYIIISLAAMSRFWDGRNWASVAISILVLVQVAIDSITLMLPSLLLSRPFGNKAMLIMLVDAGTLLYISALFYLAHLQIGIDDELKALQDSKYPLKPA